METLENSKNADGDILFTSSSNMNYGQPSRTESRSIRNQKSLMHSKGMNGNLAQIINEIDQKEPHDYFVLKSVLENCDRSQASSNRGGNNQPPKFVNEEEENEIVRQVQSRQRELMEIDPLRELDVALMDRNTASKSRLHNMVVNHSASAQDTFYGGCDEQQLESNLIMSKSDNSDKAQKGKESLRKQKT